jgi:hypothetical protein
MTHCIASLALPFLHQPRADRPCSGFGHDRGCRVRAAPWASLLAALLIPISALATSESDRLAERAREALGRAASYFREEVAVHGSYGWRYSADLAYRRGEDLLTRARAGCSRPARPRSASR